MGVPAWRDEVRRPLHPQHPGHLGTDGPDLLPAVPGRPVLDPQGGLRGRAGRRRHGLEAVLENHMMFKMDLH